MFSAVDINELAKTQDENLIKEFFGDSSWRVLPLDALPEDKFVADMLFIGLDDDMFPGSTVAHGTILNDSRGIFVDGDRVRTSPVKRIFELKGQKYIETRNTIYRVVGTHKRSRSMEV